MSSLGEVSQALFRSGFFSVASGVGVLAQRPKSPLLSKVTKRQEDQVHDCNGCLAPGAQDHEGKSLEGQST